MAGLGWAKNSRVAAAEVSEWPTEGAENPSFLPENATDAVGEAGAGVDPLGKPIDRQA